MFTKAGWQRIKGWAFAIFLLLFDAIGLFVGFLCKPDWNFLLLTIAVFVSTPLLLLLLYTLVTGHDARVAMFTNKRVVIAASGYLLFWVTIGLFLSAIVLANNTPKTSEDLQSITLTLGPTSKAVYKNDKLSSFYLSAIQYPDFQFYAPAYYFEESMADKLLEELVHGKTLTASVSKNDRDKKLDSGAMPSLIAQCYCNHIVDVYALSDHNNVYLPLDEDGLDGRHLPKWLLWVSISLFYLFMPLYLLYRLWHNYAVNKHIGWTYDK